jgi:hypothetical protein
MTSNISAPPGDATADRFVIGGVDGHPEIFFRRATEAEIIAFPPNRIAAERFLSALDPTATSWTFQTFDDDAERKAENVAKHNVAKKANARHIPPKDPFAAHPHGSLDERWSWLARMNAKKIGVFVTINETDGRGREKKNVKRVRAVFIDLDGKPLPDSFHAAPHIIVESSPGKWHAYWRVKDCALDKFKALQKRLAQHYGSDESVNDLPRVMRLPGFLHQKGEPFRTRLVEARGHPTYAVDDIARGLPELKAKPKDDGGGDGSEESADWGELYAGVVTGKSLYPALRDLALKYVFAGMTPGAIVNTLRALMDQSAARETDAARWKDRHGRIPEIVDGAIEKHAELMVPEANLRGAASPRTERPRGTCTTPRWPSRGSGSRARTTCSTARS